MLQAPFHVQLTSLVDAMSMPDRHASVAQALVAPSRASHVRMFVDGNLQKRLGKLAGQLEFVAEVFDDFEQLMVEYVGRQPLTAFDTGTSDGERMLVWLARCRDLTLRQQDYVNCQRARHAIERLARRHRSKYVRFQELGSLAIDLAATLDTNPQLCIHLNPIRTWTRFKTSALLDEAAAAPANVLFFATAGEVATSLLELEGQALINELADYQPCTLAQWSNLSALADHETLIEFCTDLAEMGLVCFS